jgi:hypothetical protein
VNKSRGKVVPDLTKYHALKTHGSVEVWRCSSTLAALSPGKEPPVAIAQEAGWASEPVWTRWREENINTLPLPGVEPGRQIHSLVTIGAVWFAVESVCPRV